MVHPVLAIADVRDGLDFEEWFFGLRQREKKSYDYLSFDESYQEAKSQQGLGWNPFDPSAIGAKRLLHYVKEGIRSITTEENPKVAINRLIGTRLDSFHGVDGSLEYREERLLFDLTISRTKHKQRKELLHRPREHIFLITLERARGDIGHLGYMMGLLLVKSLVNKNIRMNPGDIPLLDNSGEDILSIS